MTSYPEKVPQSAPIKNFYFSLDAAADSKTEIKNQISMLEERIEKIIQHFTVDDMPIIRFILNMTHDKEIIKGILRLWIEYLILLSIMIISHQN